MIAALVVLAATAVLGQDSVPDKIDAKTNRLTLVEIKSTSKSIAWVVVPAADVDVFREYDPDPAIVRLRFITYRDGSYSLVVAGSVGDKVRQVVCLITSTGGVKPPDIKPPDIDPPPPPPVKEVFGFTTLARRELAALPVAVRPLAAGLANNFEAVAAKLAATATMTPDEANAELRDRHRITLGTSRDQWLPWFVMWGSKADELNASGKMSTSAHYVAAYLETAAGLRVGSR